jgi:glycosyltransferase involved in cell wall biosynthesis
MTEQKRKVVYLTAGAGGMLCGSCLHDNTLARALIRRGVDVLLIPTYTPIRTDEENVSEQRVFLGGVNMFLDQILPAYRFLPSAVTRLMDQPWLIRWATRRASATSATSLGALTVSVLQGSHGRQSREMDELCMWLAHDARPDLVVLSNMLISGCVEQLKESVDIPVLVTLQGDDIFLDSLPEPYQAQAFAEIRRLAPLIDGFLVNSRYYAEFMSSYLGLPPEKLHIIPLGIEVGDFTGSEPPADPATDGRAGRAPTIGYFARLAPEKGLHVLVDAFLELRRRGTVPRARLHVAGWLGEHHRQYADKQRERLLSAGLGGDVLWRGEVDRRDKIAFLRGLDVLSVPTVYRDPKGLFVLEALAAGVPVVQPAHGAFPELLAATGGGELFPPGNVNQLTGALERLLKDHSLRHRLGGEGKRAVHSRFHADAMAAAAWAVMERFV